MAAGSEGRGEIDYSKLLYTQRKRKYTLFLAKTEKMESLAGEVERKVAGANGHTYRCRLLSRQRWREWRIVKKKRDGVMWMDQSEGARGYIV
jgi:hypothetical protein